MDEEEPGQPGARQDAFHGALRPAQLDLGLCLALLLTAAWFIVGRKPGQPASA